jgi:hypothetical protein
VSDIEDKGKDVPEAADADLALGGQKFVQRRNGARRRNLLTVTYSAIKENDTIMKKESSTQTRNGKPSAKTVVELGPPRGDL